MPIYEYKCAHCGHKKEVLQKLSDPPLRECPACGKAALSKLISAAGFQLKGSGWYATDFKGGAAKADKEKENQGVKAADESKTPETTKAAGGEKVKEESKPDAPAGGAKASSVQ